jgi:hypothetical protein
MANGVLIQSKVQAKDNDALNRPAVSAADVMNGNVLDLTGYSTTAGEAEVWTAVAPTTGNLSNLWMAYSPEVVITNAKYRGIDCDPRSFTNIAGRVYDVFKLEVGDIITVTGDSLAGTQSTNTFVVATNTAFGLTWAAAAVAGVSLELLEETTISLGTGAIGSQKIPAFKFEVKAIA